jgi:hypothetical protein
MNVPVFDLSSLLTIAQCDDLLARVSLLRLGVAKKDLGLSFNAGSARADAAENSLIGVNSNLTATRTQIAGLPAGASPLRRQLTIREAQLVARKLVLEAQEEDDTDPYEALTGARVDSDLELIDGFTTQVEAKKDTLSA